MSLNEEFSDKKRALLAHRNKLLNDVHYCEKRIEETRKKHTQTYYDSEDSSDSDAGFVVPIKRGPTTQQLRAETSQLSLCLQATQELTSLQVLESEVNVLVDPPKLKDGNYPDEEGTWKEALAECKVDLIPYCITFYIFQPSKRFGSPSYHQLRVTPTKSGHEKELANSILTKLTRPSDAWQVLKSYSVASRSRRSTMARLCDKFSDAIVVGTADDGGFTIKCANVLDIAWSLQNIWSPVMPFQHKMKFDLEYMDENYIKAIKHAHKQLSDPSLETDERTDILTNILNTCIEASGNISSVTESEAEQSVHLTPIKRRTTLEEEPEIPVKKRLLNKGVVETVMPPPKGVPKKTKTKDKENVNLNRNGLELQENKGSSKSKSLIRDSLNKEGNLMNKHDNFHRNSLKPTEKGDSNDKVAVNMKNNDQTKTKDSTESNNLKKNKEATVATKSKADKPIKNSEMISKESTELKQKKNLQAKENSGKDDNVLNKKTSLTKPNEKTEKENRKKTMSHEPKTDIQKRKNENREKTNENRKKTSANPETENDIQQKKIEDREKTSQNRKKTSANREPKDDNRDIHQKKHDNREKTNENRQKINDQQPKLSQPTTKEDRQTTSESRQKTTENDSQKNKNIEKPIENRQKQKDMRQKQPETQQKTNENRQKTNENARKTNENSRKQNEIEIQNDKGKNYQIKNDKAKLKTISKIPKLFKDNFKPQNFISKRLSGRIIEKTNDKGTKYKHFEKKPTRTDTSNQSDKIIKKNDKLTKQNDKVGIQNDKFKLISKSKILPPSSGNIRKQ